MKLNRLFQTALRLLLILSLSGLVACSEKEDAKPDTMSGGSVVGVNYTGEGIQVFYVDGAAGPNVGRYGGGGGFVCCATYPRKWTPDLKVTVKWERSNCEGQRHLCTLEMARQNKWPYKWVEKTVQIEKYMELGDIYVLFLPNDEVRVHISNVGVRNKNFPGNPGYPKDPDEKGPTP